MPKASQSFVLVRRTCPIGKYTITWSFGTAAGFRRAVTKMASANLP